MGNYRNLEIDFIERTLDLISQYEHLMHQYEFDKQYNHTLLINCLLGLIVMPKERAISFLPKEILTKELKDKMGVVDSKFNKDIHDLKSLIVAMRHSIAHFDITFESNDANEYLIDRIVFRDEVKGNNYTVAIFDPQELLSFIRYYATWFMHVVIEHNKEIYEIAQD
jgi:hypothetical protein